MPTVAASLINDNAVICVALTLAAWHWRRRLPVCAVLLGLACAYKQYGWFFVPFFVLDILRQRGILLTTSWAILALGAFVLPNLPFLINNPRAWFQSLWLPMSDPFFPAGMGFVALSIGHMLPFAPPWFYTALELCTLGVALYSAWRWQPGDAMLVLAVLPLFFAYRSLPDYFAFVPWLALYAANRRYCQVSTRRPAPHWLLALCTPLQRSLYPYDTQWLVRRTVLYKSIAARWYWVLWSYTQGNVLLGGAMSGNQSGQDSLFSIKFLTDHHQAGSDPSVSPQDAPRDEPEIPLARVANEADDIATQPCVIAGSASLGLAQEVARLAAIPLLERSISRFADGEMYARLGESVRGRDAFVIQSTSAPVNDNLFELLMLLDTLRRASAGRITAIIPYYGYARQDRKSSGREPITAKLVANLLAAAGANRVLAIDLHSPAIQGFFDIGMDHPSAIPLLADYLRDRLPHESVLVSPDTGGVKRADTYARMLNLPIAILHKRRSSSREVEIAAVVGDVRGKVPVIVDDIIATGGTIARAVATLVEAGARPEAWVVATHGVLTGDAPKNLNHPHIREVVVTDTIEISDEKRAAMPTLHIVSIAGLLASAIHRLHNGLSLSALFPGDGVQPI